MASVTGREDSKQYQLVVTSPYCMYVFVSVRIANTEWSSSLKYTSPSKAVIYSPQTPQDSCWKTSEEDGKFLGCIGVRLPSPLLLRLPSSPAAALFLVERLISGHFAAAIECISFIILFFSLILRPQGQTPRCCHHCHTFNFNVIAVYTGQW